MPWWPAKGEESRKMPETGSLRNKLNCSPAKSRRWRLWQENGSSHVWSRNERLQQRAATSKEQQEGKSKPHPACSNQSCSDARGQRTDVGGILYIFYQARGQYSLDDPAFDLISNNSKELIKKWGCLICFLSTVNTPHSRLLVLIPTKRLTAKAVLAHPWLAFDHKTAELGRWELFPN